MNELRPCPSGHPSRVTFLRSQRWAECQTCSFRAREDDWNARRALPSRAELKRVLNRAFQAYVNGTKHGYWDELQADAILALLEGR